MNEAGITVKGMDEVLRTVEESADATNLLVLEMALGRFDTQPSGEEGAAAGEQLVQAADRAARATAEMARLMRAAGLF